MWNAGARCSIIGGVTKLPERQGACLRARDPPYIIEPVREQFEALLPEREVDHPLGCHRSRIPDRVVFEKLVQILMFGCAHRRIADGSYSATTLRGRRDEWIACEVMETLRRIALGAYDRFIGLELAEVAVDGCITKAPCGREKAGRSPVDRESRASNARWRRTDGASLWGASPLGEWSGLHSVSLLPRQ